MAPNFSNVEAGSNSTAPDWRHIEKQLIKQEEGLSLKPYQDSLGYWTIGWGHHDDTIRSDTTPWTVEHANQVFDEDFEDAESAAKRVCASFDALNGCRKGVIVQMIFQLGESGTKKFVTMLHAIDQDDFETAARSMRTSLWAKQTPFRVRRLAARMETGEYNVG